MSGPHRVHVGGDEFEKLGHGYPGSERIETFVHAPAKERLQRVARRRIVQNGRGSRQRKPGDHQAPDAVAEQCQGDGDHAVAEYIGHGIQPSKHLELQPPLQKRPRSDGGSIQDEGQRHYSRDGHDLWICEDEVRERCYKHHHHADGRAEEYGRGETRPDVVVGQLGLLDESRSHAHPGEVLPEPQDDQRHAHETPRRRIEQSGQHDGGNDGGRDVEELRDQTPLHAVNSLAGERVGRQARLLEGCSRGGVSILVGA